MNIHELPTPCYVIDEKKLKENLEILAGVRDRTECRILLAQKAFSCFYEYPRIADYLDGTTASGLYEARLGYEEMGEPFGLETHVFAPAFKAAEFEEIAGICDHVIFNSAAQLEKFLPVCRKNGVGVGLRINPECSTQGDHAIYDPCAPGSRLGVTLENFPEHLAGELSGHIFHRENWYGFDDATYCAARLLCILSRLGEPLSALPGWPRAWITPELNLPCPDHLKFRVVEKALRWYRERFPVCDLDGARIDFGGAWGLIRASNTSPSLSMRFEADSPERMESLRAQAERLARQWMEECAGEQAGSGTACPGDRKPSCRASCTDTGRIFRKTEKNA